MATVAGLALAFLVLAWPVWQSSRVLDPLNDFYTDHLRYRYCAALTIASPLRALTNPLSALHAEDPRVHKVLLWEAQPCHQPGIVFLAFHAPVQWLLDAELISETRATALQVLLLLALVHLAIGWMLLSRFWWAGLLVYPFLLRCALNGLQEPLPFLFAVLGAFSWTKGQRLRGLTLVVLAFSAYSRWLVWVAGFAWLCWRDRRAVLEELRSTAWPARVGLVAVALVLGWSLFGNWLVSTVWVAAPSRIKWAELALLVGYAGCWGAYWWRSRQSQVAPRTSLVREAGVEARVHLLHVLIDDPEGEVFLVLEVMVKRSLRRTRGRKQSPDTEIVVPMLQQHRQTRIEQPLLGGMRGVHPGEP